MSEPVAAPARRKQIGWALAGAVLALAAVAAAVFLWRGGDRSRVEAVFTPTGVILVPARIGGAEDLFILDTGSQRTVVTPRIAPRLEATGRTSRVHSRPCLEPRQADIVRTGEIRFAGHRLLYPKEVVSLDLPELRAVVGHDLGGVLSWDVLRNYVVGIDLAGNRVVAGRRLTVEGAFRRLGARGPDTEIPLKIIDDRPAVAARAAGVKLRLLLDTGATRTIISSAAWGRLGKPVPEGPPTSSAVSVAGSFAVRRAQLDELWVGSLRLDDVTVAIPVAEHCPEAQAASADGLLGLDLLVRHIAVIDGRAEALHLVPRPGRAE